MTEDELIETLFAPIAGPAGLGLRDDAALLRPEPGFDQVVTVDALVAGVHFFADDPPESIARKALRVNLSDLAAKGARPTGFVLAIALPTGWTADWLRAFASGLGADAKRYGCPLLGGDTVRTPGPFTISITALGAVPTGRMVQRTTAKPGDALYVSGTIGDAALGLRLRLAAAALSETPLLDPEQVRFLLDRYLHPQPRQALAKTLLAHASSAMDVSDGLVGDVTKMLKSAGLTGRIDLGRVPLSAAARACVDADPGSMETAVTGGDDYEILASVPPGSALAFEAAADAAAVPVTRIGEVASGLGPPRVIDAGGRAVEFSRGSFSHF